MKRLMSILACMILTPFMLNAVKIQRAVFNYSIDNFNIVYPDSLVFAYSPIIGSYNPPFEPAVPSIDCPIPIPKGKKCIGYRVEAPDTIKICEGRDLAVTEGPLFIDGKYAGLSKIKKWEPAEGGNAVFPVEKVSYDFIDDNVGIYPMEYNADKKELFLTPTVIIDFILAEENADGKEIQKSMDNEEDEIIDFIIFQGTTQIEF